jgi:hypothetical protein
MIPGMYQNNLGPTIYDPGNHSNDENIDAVNASFLCRHGA